MYANQVGNQGKYFYEWCEKLLSCQYIPLWRHDTETSWALLVLYEGNPLVSPHKGLVMQSTDDFFIVSLNNPLTKQGCLSSETSWCLYESLQSLHCLSLISLQWRHNECAGVSNHWRFDCLLNCLFRRRSKKTSKLGVTGICEDKPPVTDEFLA